jgi:hypothetical protein
MKSEQRITLATDRRERQINFTEMLWSSESTHWSGFRLEKHRIGPRGHLHDFGVPDILLGVCVSGSAQMQYARRGDHATRRGAHGAVHAAQRGRAAALDRVGWHP